MKGVSYVLARLTYYETSRDMLSQLDITSGQFVRCFDTDDIFYDVNNITRIRTSRVQVVPEEDDRVDIQAPEKNILYIVLETKSFYRFSNGDWRLVSNSEDITDIIAIYSGLNIATATSSVGNVKTKYAPRTLARAVYTDDGCNLEDVVKHITQLGTSIDYVTATSNNQTTFTIPFPFENYLKGGNSMMIFIGSTFVDNRRWEYNSNQTKITFLNNVGVKIGRTVTFVFLYNSRTPVNTDVVNTFMDGKYIANKSIPIIKMEKVSSSLYEEDINTVATSAAVARLYESLLNKIDAIGTNYARYARSSGTSTKLKVTLPNYTLTDCSLIHVRLNTSPDNDATISVNGGPQIPIYRDYFNRIATGDVFEEEVLSLFYNAEENRFYMFDGLNYKLKCVSLMYTTVQANENTFDISALDYEDGKDILEVYQDGIHLVEDANYRNNHNGTISLIGYQVNGDVEFTFLIHSIRKINIYKPATTLSTTPGGNPGGSGVVYGEDEEDMDNITIGNWKVYTDSNGSNNLLFLYNNVLKFTMTPAGNMVASDYTERD